MDEGASPPPQEQGPPPPAPTTRKEARYRAALDAGHISRDAYDRAVAEPDTAEQPEAEKVAQKPGSLVDRVVRVTKGSHDKKLSGSLGMVEAWDSRAARYEVRVIGKKKRVALMAGHLEAIDDEATIADVKQQLAAKAAAKEAEAEAPAPPVAQQPPPPGAPPQMMQPPGAPGAPPPMMQQPPPMNYGAPPPQRDYRTPMPPQYQQAPPQFGGPPPPGQFPPYGGPPPPGAYGGPPPPMYQQGPPPGSLRRAAFWRPAAHDAAAPAAAAHGAGRAAAAARRLPGARRAEGAAAGPGDARGAATGVGRGGDSPAWPPTPPSIRRKRIKKRRRANRST